MIYIDFFQTILPEYKHYPLHANALKLTLVKNVHNSGLKIEPKLPKIALGNEKWNTGTDEFGDCGKQMSGRSQTRCGEGKIYVLAQLEVRHKGFEECHHFIQLVLWTTPWSKSAANRSIHSIAAASLVKARPDDANFWR